MNDRKLFVLRHAKSSWDDPGQDDRDRPLAPRGRRAVKVIAAYVRELGISPEQVLCSPARRTLETLEGVAPGGETLIEPELYGASAAEIIERLRRVPDEVGSVMVVGHNPAMQILVLRLADSNGPLTSATDLAEVQRKFPTGALATLSFECAWHDLGRSRAQLVSFMRPKAVH